MHVRSFAFSVMMALLLVGCSGPGTAVRGDDLGDEAPSPGDTGATTEGAEDSQPPSPEELAECEELFATLNSIDTNSADLNMLAVAESRADEGKDRCLQVFLANAGTEGRKAVAGAFADLMHLRLYELKMSRLSRNNDLRTVCEDTEAILERMRGLRTTVGATLEDNKELQDDELGVLQQVLSTAQIQVNALEPFVARGCVDGTFVPERFVQVDDLKVGKSMSVDQCRDLVVAFAAFDVEQAAADQIQLLEKVLSDAVEPCTKSLLAGQPATPTNASLENARLAELIERGPLLLRSSRGLSSGETDAACSAMAGFLAATRRSITRLTAVTQAAELHVDVRVLAGAELELATGTLREFEATYAAACGL